MPKNYNFYVYIMVSASGTLYIGMTNDLERRVYEHKHRLTKGFSKKYSCNKLMYLEHFSYVNDAIAYEKKLKGWKRSRKEELIKENNPHWKDLSENWPGQF